MWTSTTCQKTITCMKDLPGLLMTKAQHGVGGRKGRGGD